MNNSLIINVIIALSLLLIIQTLSSPQSFLVSAFGFDKSSLFTNSHSVIDLDRSRLSFVSPEASDSCPWVVLFYDSMCGHCREFAGPFSKFAEKELLTRGIFVGAINCAAQESLCVSSNVSDVPTIFVGIPKLTSSSSVPVDDDTVSNNNNNNNNEKRNLFDQERNKAINELVKDASPFIKSSNGGGKDIRVANHHQRWRVATSEIPQDATDPQILAHLKEIVEKEWTPATSPVFGTCKDVVGTLCLKKQQIIEFRSAVYNNYNNNNKNTGNAVADSSPSSSVLNKNIFVPPPNHPCPQDLAGALYIALKHEVAVSFSTALAHELNTNQASKDQNNNDIQQQQQQQERLLKATSSQRYQNLLHTVAEFLNYIHLALPELRAGDVLDLIRKDPLAPTKTDDGSWGYQVYKTMFKGENDLKMVQHNVLQDIERDFVVFDDEHREEHEKLHELYSPPITSIVWSSCRGSNPNYRGYTCGLWMLFHTVLSNSPQSMAPKALRALHDYILRFFMCLECRVHFSQFRFQEFYDDEEDGGGDDKNKQEENANNNNNNYGGNHAHVGIVNNKNGDAISNSNKKNIKTKKLDVDAVMWLFRAHNAVNRRLALSPQQQDDAIGQEQDSLSKKSSSSSTNSPAVSLSSSSSSSTDPLVPKVQFPPRDLCPGGCTSKSSEQELFTFLNNHYNWRKITRSISFCHRQKLHNSKNWFDQLKDEGRRQKDEGGNRNHFGNHDDPEERFHVDFFWFMFLFVLLVVSTWTAVAVKMGYWSELMKLVPFSGVKGRTMRKMHSV